MSFTATIFVSPVGKGRPRFTKQGRAYTPSKTVAAENAIKMWLVQMNPPRLEGPLALHATFFLKRPKSVPKKRLYPNVRPDLDNYLKLILDAANGLLFEDDAQVVSATLLKAYGDPERIELALTRMGETA